MTAAQPPERQFIEIMAKHLPPSGARLRLLDVGGRTGEALFALRPDLDVIPVEGAAWPDEPDSADAVAVYDYPLDAPLLRAALSVLRPGGRLIAVDPSGLPGEVLVHTLEENGYTRVLVENALDASLPGVLMRGEKPHVEARPVDRVQQVAARDAAGRGGRFVHVLVRQVPNKPVWSLQPGDTVEWNAVAVAGHDETVLLAFSSLPKAVAFMQPSVLAGRIQGVNKVAKYRWEVVQAWPFPVMINPTEDILETNAVTFVQVDPASAEAPDE